MGYMLHIFAEITVAVERVGAAVVLLTRIREVLGSNLDWDFINPN
jgi:hypothetical protein